MVEVHCCQAFVAAPVQLCHGHPLQLQQAMDASDGGQLLPVACDHAHVVAAAAPADLL